MSDAALKLLREKAETIVAGQEQIKSDLAIQRKELAELKEKTAVPQYPAGVTPQNVYGGMTGGISQPYSILKMAALSAGFIEPDKCKYELDVSAKLDALYRNKSWTGGHYAPNKRFLVPFAIDHIPTETDAEERTVAELKQKMVADAHKVDPDEVAWIKKRAGYRQKDLSTLVDTQGGTLVGFPTLGELVDIQRNIEVFPQAGASERPLPANGRLRIPKLTNTTTANWIGEGAQIPESTPATGDLDLIAKKLGIFVDINNELLRFNMISAEAMLRGDMSAVAALKMDLACLEGTGGTQIKGLITYDSAASWVTGQDKLLTYTVTSNKFQINDAAEMEAKLPDTANLPTAWVMRKQLWAKIRNRRTDSVTVTDGAGPYLASITRNLQERQDFQLDGTKVVRSTQVSATRGSGSNTYVLLGYFPDWIIARFGVLEFLSTNVSDTALQNDQTRIRCIQHVDAGARHASSFCFADDISIS